MHIIQAACYNNTSTCMCAVMVKSADDVVTIDHCASSGAVDVRLHLNDKLTPGTHIARYEDGKMFRVC